MKNWFYCVVLGVTALASFAAETLSEIRRNAEAGDAVAQFTLGGMYSNGLGVTKNGQSSLPAQ